jgi:HPt (histidine-containing phosphotransfer) domain-containing protein
MSHIWQRTKGVNLERVACLDQAVQAISTAELTPELQQAAIHAAHKLVGSLGTFGFKAGSKIAQQFEVTLQQFTSDSNSDSKSSSKPTAKSPAKSDVTRDDLTQLEGWVQSLRHLVQQNDSIPADDSVPALKLAEQALSDSNGCRSQSQPCDLLVLTTDQDWVKTIKPQVFEQNLHLVAVTTVAAAIHQCQQISS